MSLRRQITLFTGCIRLIAHSTTRPRPRIEACEMRSRCRSRILSFLVTIASFAIYTTFTEKRRRPLLTQAVSRSLYSSMRRSDRLHHTELLATEPLWRA